jgi:serine/threonine protein kinase
MQASIPTEAGRGAASKSAPPTQAELAAAFPQLEILELIGQGGMGFVFKARQPKLDRFVALKILPASLAADPAFAERFTREGRMLARLTHPNIVAIHDFGQANGFFYLLMEFVDGVNLRQAMKVGRFTPAQALAVVPKICEALQFAHNEGVLHRDIKPENILLDSKGRVKIADFGIAKLVGADRTALTPSLSHPMGEGGAPAPGEETRQQVNLTEIGKALGTPNYMAPEQIEHPQDVDQRADIYSLGVVFYEMLTGELPLGRFAPPSERSTADPRLDEVVLRTLEKERERRTQTAGEVKTQVETIASGIAPSDLETVWLQPAPPGGIRSRRVKMAVTAGLGLALVFVFGLALLIRYSGKHDAGSEPSGKQGAGSEPDLAASIGPFTKTFVLTRATNQWVGDTRETQTVGVWTATTVDPGETLLSLVKRSDGSLAEAQSLLFIRWQPNGVTTSTSLSWFFGGVFSQGFGEDEAQAAASQLRENMSDRPLTLIAGEPLELFTVTNRSGGIMAGYVKYMRSVPKSPERSGRSVVKPQAIVHVRRYVSALPSISYSVTLPPGYALWATASLGQATTHFPQASKPGDYYTAWFRQTMAPSDYRDYPARMKAERTTLEEQFQALLDRGPIPVVLGEPCQVFALTNKNAEVYRGFFELVAPSSGGAMTNTPRTQAAPIMPPGNAANSAPRPRAGRPSVPANPADSASTAQTARVPGRVPHLTGTLTPMLDPATGLPVPVGEPVPPEATSILPVRLDVFGKPVPPGSAVLYPRLGPDGNPMPPGATRSGPRSN